ncbi:MAG: aspartyl protease family protein [Candidatus Zixiibacteriota bacterium]|nr:MAG: aspartyl protease family protein [candidate division Zixibacteria bacterium]
MLNLRTLTISSVLCFAMATGAPAFANPKVGEKPERVPFKLDRNRVIVPTSVNGSSPLNLILDTGMRFDGVYLFHKELAAEIDTTGAIEVKVPGAGAGEPSTAIMIETGRLVFGDVTVDSQRVLISSSPHTQNFPTDGVIGWNFFGHYTVEIDYDTRTIVLHETGSFQADTTWRRVPVVMKKDMPFLQCELEVIPGDTVSATMYIDLASGDALELLVRDDQKFSMPDDLEQGYLGTGLSGDITGHRGRSHRLCLEGYDLFDVATSFAPATVRSKQEGADGILGGDAIRRFNIVFDYAHSRLFIRPNSHFREPFE